MHLSQRETKVVQLGTVAMTMEKLTKLGITDKRKAT